MTTLTIIRGLPGSGKTTHAKAWVAEDPQGRARVNRDDLRAMMFGATTGLTFAQEKTVTAVEHQIAETHLRAGRDVIVDDTHLRTRYVKPWVELALRCNAAVLIHEMPIDLDSCIARDALRPQPVGEQAIRALAERYTPDKARVGRAYLPCVWVGDAAPEWEPHVPNPDLPPAVIVDIDGTIALMGDRSPYDWARVGEDRPNDSVVKVVGALFEAGFEIVFLSGRDDSCYDATKHWISANTPVTGDLFMRPAGDTRRGDIVKHELFNAHIRGRYDVAAVLDDRDSVVAMWRAMGLTCLQVAPGAF